MTTLTNHEEWLKGIHGSPLQPGARHLAYELALTADAEGRCSPTYPELEKLTGQSRSKVTRHLRGLREAGYLTWVVNGGPVIPGTRHRPNLFTLETPEAWDFGLSRGVTDASPRVVAEEGSLHQEASSDALLPAADGLSPKGGDGVSPPMNGSPRVVIEEVVTTRQNRAKRLWAWVSEARPGAAWITPKGLGVRAMATPKGLGGESQIETDLCWLCTNHPGTTADGLCAGCSDVGP